MSGRSGVIAVARSLSSKPIDLDPAGLFKDKALSARYDKFRPKLPTVLIETIVGKLLGGRRPGLWLDVGCGPGNSTQQIIGHADRIVGVDISETQIEVARKAVIDPSVSFATGGCDSLPVESNSVDVITAVQAAHYFDLPAFFKEVDRVLKPGGALALILFKSPACISCPTLGAAHRSLDKVLMSYGTTALHRYYIPNYTTITLPWEVESGRHVVEHDTHVTWDMENTLDYLLSYSMTTRACEERRISMEEWRGWMRDYYRERGVESDGEQTWCHTALMVAATRPSTEDK